MLKCRCWCNANGRCKNYACVKDGQPCLPSRKGTCSNQSTQSTPTVNQLAEQSRPIPPPSECEGVNERAATGIRLNIEQTAQIPPLLGTRRESAGELPRTPASECEEMQPILTYSHDNGDARRHIFLALVALKLLVSLISRLVVCSARIVADKQTNRQTDTQNDYCNPRCACAPRVN